MGDTSPLTRAEQFIALLPHDNSAECFQWVIDNFDALHDLYNRDLNGLYAKWQESLLLRLPEGM